jgi:hypothetical protein
MTHRQRILAALRGDIPDQLPWVPRLEFWHRARLRQGTLPAELRSLSLPEIADRLGVGCYAVVPDFTDCERDDDMLDRALGIFNLPVLPYRVTLDGVDRRVLRRGRETVIEYHTPVGPLRTATIFTDEMLDAGASMSWITEHAIREPRHFAVAGHIFSHLHVEPCLDGYLARRDRIGDRGIVVAYTNGCAGPIHHIMKELLPLEEFFYALHDCPEAVHRLADQIRPYYQAIQQCAADSPAEVVLFGGNYDDSITYPPFFTRYILPELRAYAEVLHRRGKYLMTHTDGENRRLLPLYREADFDVADSVCPAPMTSCTLEELRQGFGDRITIWGGIPSVLLCPDSAGDQQFRAFIDGLVARYSGYSHLILGVSDMVTADCDWDLLLYITEAVRSP